MTIGKNNASPQSWFDFCKIGAAVRAHGVHGAMIFKGDFHGGFNVLRERQGVFPLSLFEPQNDNAPEAA